MAGELEQVANGLMAAIEEKDLDRIVRSIGEDSQGVDEISATLASRQPRA
jgi:hypothetical protein